MLLRDEQVGQVIAECEDLLAECGVAFTGATRTEESAHPIQVTNLDAKSIQVCFHVCVCVA